MTETSPGLEAGPATPPPPTADDPCLALRVEAERRCQAAEEARRAALELTERLAAAREEREACRKAVEAATAAADPAAVRSWRRRARATFQAARGTAATAAAIAAAASAWLAEVERLNTVAAETSGRLERQRAAEEIAVAVLEHLSAEAEAARIAAARAEASCQAARQAATECDDKRVSAAPSPPPAIAPVPPTAISPAAMATGVASVPGGAAPPLASSESVAAGSESRSQDAAEEIEERRRRQAEQRRRDDLVARDREAREREAAADARLQALTVIPSGPGSGAEGEGAAASRDRGMQPAGETVDPGRLLPDSTVNAIMAGDLTALVRIAAALSDEPAGRRRWEARLIELLQAILLRAIDASAIGLPADHPFWGAFTPEQGRDILSALAALGYRLDGLGGWLDGRVPGTRDLSIAVGHAGLDPMRIRRWPAGQEAADLVRDAEILGAEFLAATAPTLAAEDLIEMLGDGPSLVEVWAAWDQVRPLLLAPALPPPADAPTRPGWWARLKAGGASAGSS